MTLVVTGCASVSEHQAAVGQESNLTVAKAQHELAVGMSGAQVIQAMGSPNIISTDEKRREVWVYDKISTESSYSSSGAGAGLGSLIFGSLGLAGVHAYGQSGASSRGQKTLTVVVRFDEDGMVRDFSYHTSKF